MVALNDDRNTPALAGNIVKGVTGLNLVGVGRAEQRVDNSSGAAGAKTIPFQRGVFRFANSAAGDLITIADIGKACFVVDDQTVAKTNGTNTRSKAGIVDDVDANGVWVLLDEAITNGSA